MAVAAHGPAAIERPSGFLTRVNLVCPQPVATMLTPLPRSHQRLHLMLSILVLAGLSACGGGAGTDNLANSGSAVPDTTIDGAPPDRRIAAVSATARTVAPPSLLTAAAPAANSQAVGDILAINAFANLAIVNVPDRPQGATAMSRAVKSQTIYYIDSAAGDDRLSGRAAAAVGNGDGPWRSLGRLSLANLKPGDTVQLACGSNWRETLRLPSNGTAALPIRVQAATGCSTPPAIDGSIPIAPSSWKPFRGNIYQTVLDVAPLQLSMPAATFTAAHHPNRVSSNGVLSSPYLRLAGDGNTATVAGKTGSTVLPTGADLVLPSGVDLGAGGARLRVRSLPYVIDEAPVTSFDGKSITISRPSTYPTRAGSGYLLLGQLWMLDSAGEWHYEPTSRQLYVWMPDSQAPSEPVFASTLDLGVDLSARKNVVLDGLAIRRTGTGVDLRKSVNIQLINTVVEDIANTGINAAGSAQVTLESNYLTRIGADAITGQGTPIAYATELVVRNNVIRDSGVVMQGEEVVSVPRRSLAAIVGATGSVITGNTVINTGYNGILAVSNSLVQDNFIFGTCSVQDDCGAIYTGGAQNQSRIRNNIVARSRGMVFGLPGATPGTSAQGIYVDDQGSGLLIEGNTVVDADYGLHLHNASVNTVQGNLLYSNRRAQIWLQEDTKTKYSQGDVSGNEVLANVLAPTSPDAYGHLMTSAFDSTINFATFSSNRYLDSFASKVMVTAAGGASRSFSLAQWLSTESTAWGSSLKPDLSYSVASGNLLAAPENPTNATLGWYSWNATAPAGKLWSESCSSGTCVRYVAGGSAGVMSSPGFAIQKGNWYRISMDVATEQDNQNIPLVVRVGGGDYGRVSDRNLGFTASRATKRYSQLFQATRSLDPNLMANGPLKARIDIDGVDPGRSVSVANVELVQVVPNTTPPQSVSLVNAGAAPSSVACPFASTNPAACARLHNLVDDKPVTWPAQLPARGALILYTRD